MGRPVTGAIQVKVSIFALYIDLEHWSFLISVWVWYKYLTVCWNNTNYYTVLICPFLKILLSEIMRVVMSILFEHRVGSSTSVGLFNTDWHAKNNFPLK